MQSKRFSDLHKSIKKIKKQIQNTENPLEQEYYNFLLNIEDRMCDFRIENEMMWLSDYVKEQVKDLDGVEIDFSIMSTINLVMNHRKWKSDKANKQASVI